MTICFYICSDFRLFNIYGNYYFIFIFKLNKLYNGYIGVHLGKAFSDRFRVFTKVAGYLKKYYILKKKTLFLLNILTKSCFCESKNEHFFRLTMTFWMHKNHSINFLNWRKIGS